MLQNIVNNVVVQILLGIGGMVFLITLDETIRSAVAKNGTKMSKESEMKVKADLQKEIMNLRQEIDDLKSTLLEHSMSLDNNVETLKRRLEHVERRA